MPSTKPRLPIRLLAIGLVATTCGLAHAAPYRLLVGHTSGIFDPVLGQLGPVKEDYGYLGAHSSIIFDYMNRAIPWDVFADAHTYAEYRQILGTGGPEAQEWLTQADAIKAGLGTTPVYIAEEVIESRLCIRSPLTSFPASFYDGAGIATYRQPAARAAAANYAGFLVQHFEPIAYSPFIELDTTRHLIQGCPSNPTGPFCNTAACLTPSWNSADEWQAIKDTYAAIFQKVRSINPDVAVFPTWLWHTIVEHENAGTQFGFPLLREFDSIPGATMDMIGLSSYPLDFPAPYQTPAPGNPYSWDRAATILKGGRPVIIEETGYLEGSPYTGQTAYYAAAIPEARRLRMPFLINYYLRDPLVDYGPCCGIGIYPFGMMEIDYTPKPALALFDAAIAYTPTADLTFIERQKDATLDPNSDTAIVDGLSGAIALALSPDGANLYVAGYRDKAIAVFRRNRWTGKLVYATAYKDTPANDLGLQHASGVAVSPDGAHVYSTGYAEHAVTAFARDANTGTLTLVGVQKDTNGFDLGIRGASSVAISPDGNTVYVTGYLDNAVGVFARNPTTGALTILERERDNVNEPSDPAPAVDGMAGPWSVAVSPDGANVYVAAYRDGTLVVFDRDIATGRLSYRETQYDSPDHGLRGARSVAVSPDGAHVYTAAARDDAVAVFARAPGTGALTFVEMHKDSPIDRGLNGARAVAVSPDGLSLYAAGSSDRAVAQFTRNPSDGRLTFVQREKDQVDDPNDLGGPVDGLSQVRALAVSPDGAHLYAAGYSDRAVAAFWTTE